MLGTSTHKQKISDDQIGVLAQGICERSWWNKQSEDKAKFIVTLNTVVVGVVNGLVFIGADEVRSVRLLYTSPTWILVVLAGLALIGSYLFVLRAMWPRHRSRDMSLPKSERLWFFGDLASMRRHEYEAAVASWTEENLERTMVAQNHILSRNVWTKHQALNWGSAFSIVALILLLALGIAYGTVVASASTE